MNKKIIIVLFLLFLATGCSADYTIKIYDGKIEENLSVVENDLVKAEIVDDMEMSFKDYALEYSQNDKIYTSYYNMYSDDRDSCVVTADNDCSFYNSSYMEDSSKVGFSLYSNFTFNNYSDATIPNDFVPGFVSTYDGKHLNINGGSNWNFLKSYSNLDEINVNIHTNYKVVSTNAVDNGNGHYSWKINVNNFKDMSSFYMILDTTSTVNFVNSRLIVLIIVGIIAVIGIVLLISLKSKMKENNRI